jgi:acyl-coenzyme A thioesterase PaaI-like protein
LKLNTHLDICGNIISLEEGKAVVELTTNDMMVADSYGLVHGGFTFGAADFCAMAVVNHPYVVLAKSEVKFLAPTYLGETIVFSGKIIQIDGKKTTIEVFGLVGEKKVFQGEFLAVTLDKHIKEM